MKLHTSKEQTQHLIDLGFPTPTNTIEVDGYPLTLLDDYASTTDRFGWVKCYYGYTIGELIAFLEANTDISIWYDGKSGYWYVDYDLRRVGLDEYLINALYFACKKLKEEKSI